MGLGWLLNVNSFWIYFVLTIYLVVNFGICTEQVLGRVVNRATAARNCNDGKSKLISGESVKRRLGAGAGAGVGVGVGAGVSFFFKIKFKKIIIIKKLKTNNNKT